MRQLVKLLVENPQSIPDYTDQLSSVFGDSITLQAYTMNDPAAYETHREAVTLCSAFSSADFSELKKTRLQDTPLIPIALALPKKSLLRLNGYPKGTTALVVNVTKFMAEETMAQLCQAGFGHIHFLPWYPGCSTDPREAALAVTPGEAGLVPPGIPECIDLGPRLIDIVTIIELGLKLNYEYILRTRRFFEYFDKQFNTSAGVSLMVEQNQLLEERLSDLVQLCDQGVLGISASGQIFDCNFKAAALLHRSRGDLLGVQADTVLPVSLLERCRHQQLTLTQPITLGENSSAQLQLVPITRGTQYLGAYALLSSSEGMADNAAPTSAAARKGHVAKYQFSSLIGSSPALTQAVELAQKMARTDSSILITGESGTGKELFAHAIHNNSRRSQAPFVAINCAALPDELLESELFGYEEGAFTGAKKGGKVGLFELANTGSIFLDEIEGMAASTQLKLLRVIQEREMMRLGGDRIIPIDVRIISASNQDLRPLMETGQFRQDLFYRVSTLPLDLPPLRRRREDILLLMEHFKSELRQTFVLTEDAKEQILSYSWPGNIRELRNCVEYLGCQNLPVIEPEHLPYTIFTPHSGGSAGQTAAQKLETELLQILSSGPCGRKQLQHTLASRGLSVTESCLRRELERLKAMGLVTSGVGRAGSSLTEAGLAEFKKQLDSLF